jgi:hypothetical protein
MIIVDPPDGVTLNHSCMLPLLEESEGRGWLC